MKTTKTQLTFARVDQEIVKKYKETCKCLNIKPGHDLERYMAEVVRTKGLVVREAEAEELIRRGTELRIEVNAMRLNLREAFTDGLLNDVIKSLSRKTKEGAICQSTYESIEYAVKRISEKHQVPNTTVLNCMRQQIYELYQDDNGELDRIIKILDGMQEAEFKVVA